MVLGRTTSQTDLGTSPNNGGRVNKTVAVCIQEAIFTSHTHTHSHSDIYAEVYFQISGGLGNSGVFCFFSDSCWIPAPIDRVIRDSDCCFGQAF